MPISAVSTSSHSEQSSQARQSRWYCRNRWESRSVPFFTRKPLLETVKGFFRLNTSVFPCTGYCLSSAYWLSQHRTVGSCCATLIVLQLRCNSPSGFTLHSSSRSFHKRNGSKRSFFDERLTIGWLTCNIIIGQSFAFHNPFFTSIYYCIIVKLI